MQKRPWGKRHSRGGNSRGGTALSAQLRCAGTCVCLVGAWKEGGGRSMDVHPPIPSNADGRGSLGAGGRKEGWAGLP
jgi:hypothetical protein